VPATFAALSSELAGNNIYECRFDAGFDGYSFALEQAVGGNPDGKGGFKMAINLSFDTN